MYEYKQIKEEALPTEKEIYYKVAQKNLRLTRENKQLILKNESLQEEISRLKSIAHDFAPKFYKNKSAHFIQKVICLYYNVSMNEICSKSRKREIVIPRQVLCYMIKHHAEKTTLKNIGKIIQRDHSTVIHACQTVKDLMFVDKIFTKEIEEISEYICRNNSVMK